jgi:hypothetical protein
LRALLPRRIGKTQAELCALPGYFRRELGLELDEDEDEDEELDDDDEEEEEDLPLFDGAGEEARGAGADGADGRAAGSGVDRTAGGALGCDLGEGEGEGEGETWLGARLGVDG